MPSRQLSGSRDGKTVAQGDRVRWAFRCMRILGKYCAQRLRKRRAARRYRGDARMKKRENRLQRRQLCDTLDGIGRHRDMIKLLRYYESKPMTVFFKQA